MISKKIFLLLLSLFSLSCFSQPVCGFDNMHPRQAQQGQRQAIFERLNPSWQKMIATKASTTTSYTIPVVVHIIETGTVLGTPQKPSDAQIISGINALTQAFRATYPGYPGISNGGVDIDISFQLAKRDPDCNPTNGIVRIDKSNDQAFLNSIVSSTDIYTIYGWSHWNPQDYCNIYLFTNTYGGFSSYAEYPAPNLFEGVGLGTNYFPAFGSQSTRLLAHEMGHYLGLYHTFGGSSDPNTICSPNSNCAVNGDCVCDTDPHLQVCPNGNNYCGANTINVCTGQPLGNLYYNYMSYYADTISLFTQGQKARMLQLSTQFRSSVLNSQAIYPPQPTTPDASIYAMYQGAGVMPYCEGDLLDFFVTGNNHGSSPQYTWYINGIATTTTTSQGPVSFTVHATDTVTCKLNTSSLCATTPTVLSNKYVFPALPGSPISGSVTRLVNDTLCIGDSLIFFCQLNNPGSYTYQWFDSYGNPNIYDYSSFPNSTILRTVVDTSHLANSFSQFSPGWLYINCGAWSQTYCTTPRSIFLRDSVYIGGVKPAKPTLTLHPGYLECSPAPSYQWYLVGSGSITGATSRTYTPTQNGSYYCIIHNRCPSAPSDPLSFFGTGLSQQTISNAISVFPNPASDELKIRSEHYAITKTEILTISGQLLNSESQAGKLQTLNLSGFPNGIYIVKICDESGAILYKKLVIEKNK